MFLHASSLLAADLFTCVSHPWLGMVSQNENTHCCSLSLTPRRFSKYFMNSSGLSSTSLRRGRRANKICWKSATKWWFPKIGVPPNGWFIMENPIKTDDLEVPLFQETLPSDVCKNGAYPPKKVPLLTAETMIPLIHRF